MAFESRKNPITERIAAYLDQAPAMPLSQEVAAKAQHHILDSIAAMVSGAALEPGRIAVSYARKYGGAPAAVVAGSALRTDIVTAALANGMCAHADETDDFHVASITHPGSAVVPAALVLAEAQNAPGARFLRAVVAGYELCCRMVMAIDAERTFAEGRATHGLGGLFGAAAAASVVLGLRAEQVPHLLSYAAQQASGLVCWRRDLHHVEKAFDFSGAAARNGVQTATMIAHGMTGVPDALEGPLGFFAVFGRGVDPTPAWRDFGERPIILDACIKKWCVGSPNQAPLDALEAIGKEERLEPAAIEAITVRLPSNVIGIVDHGPMANVNCQHLLALHIVDGGLTFRSSHDQERMSDPAVLALRERIRLEPDEALAVAHPPRQGIVEIRLRDGRLLRHHAKVVRGTPQNPMTEDEVAAKALDLMRPVLGYERSRRVADTVLRLESLGNTAELARMLATSKE
ncbi:MAG TPA: MmgE/PrpD family protein [Hyphomicrobiaceae bacterium]|nr:MmgE/PrpD family protein [Hyphomicrobiaceae bacterium]